MEKGGGYPLLRVFGSLQDNCVAPALFVLGCAECGTGIIERRVPEGKCSRMYDWRESVMGGDACFGVGKPPTRCALLSQACA